MKYLFLILFIAGNYHCGNNTVANKVNDLRSIRQYSYFIAGLHNQQLSNAGTGFIIKKENDLYLLTNYHVAMGFAPNEPDSAFLYDSLIVLWFTDSSVSFVTSLHTKRDEQLEQEIRANLHPDAVAIKLDESKFIAREIHPINDQIDEKYFDLMPDSVLIYGFPADSLHQVSFRGQQSMFAHGKQVSTSKIYGYSNIELQFHPDDRSVLIPRFEQLNFLINVSGFTFGMSGSPVFGKFSDNGKNRYKFIGMGQGENYIIKVDEIVKASAVMNLLK